MNGKILTVDQLKSMPFRLKMHLNGGNEFLAMFKDNEEFGLVYSYRTNGRPEFEYTERSISTANGEIVANLLSGDFEGELARFVEQYNSKV